MIDRGIPPKEAWPAGVLNSLLEWEQGDVVSQPPFFYYADPSIPIWHATAAYTADAVGPEVILPTDSQVPPFGMVTSQTCDIAEEDSTQPRRPWVQIAPVYEVTSWRRTKLEGGKGPGYWLLIPRMPETGVWVVDFRLEVPVEKSWLAGQTRIDVFADPASKRDVGARVAQMRGRPAFSRALNRLHQGLIDKLLGLRIIDPELDDRLTSNIEEIAVQVDNELNPTDVQLIFLTSVTMPPDCREWLEEWRDSAALEARAADMTLLGLDFRTVDSIMLLEYRRMTRIW